MNPILRLLAKLEIKSALSSVYIPVFNEYSGEIMMSLRLLRCKAPYSEYILSLLMNDYLEQSSIYSDLDSYVEELINNMGTNIDVGNAIEVGTNEIESEIKDYMSGIGDMRTICISVFNTDSLP